MNVRRLWTVGITHSVGDDLWPVETEVPAVRRLLPCGPGSRVGGLASSYWVEMCVSLSSRLISVGVHMSVGVLPVVIVRLGPRQLGSFRAWGTLGLVLLSVVPGPTLPFIPVNPAWSRTDQG